MQTYKYKLFRQNFDSSDAFRVIEDNGEKSRKILLFGCSYAYGSQLEDKDTFAYKLSEKFNAKVYNRSFPGWGLQHMLYQLKEQNSGISINSVDDNIDTVIYLFFNNHLDRLNQMYWASDTQNIFNLRYKLEKGKLVEEQVMFPALHTLNIVKAIDKHIENVKNSEENKENNLKLMREILSQSRDLLKAKYPQARLIFLSYYNYEKEKYNGIAKVSGWEYIEPSDFLFDDVNLCDKEYHFDNDPHPNGHAWETITDGLRDRNIL